MKFMLLNFDFVAFIKYFLFYERIFLSEHRNALTGSFPDQVQVFTNFVHGYDHAHNVHSNGVTRARKFVHIID